MKRSLNICVLGAASSPHVITRAKVFQDRGHRVRIISPVPPAANEMDVLYPRARGSGIWGKARLLAWTISTVCGQRADIYHAHYAAEVGTWVAWLTARRPLAITVMGGDILFDEQGTLGPIGRWLTRRCVRGADYVTVKNNQLGKIAQTFGAAAGRIETVIWGIDITKYARSPEGGAAYRAELGIAPDRTVIYSPRMLQPFYNIECLVDAFVVVHRQAPDAVLLLSAFRSDHDYQARLERKINTAGLEASVVFAPALPESDMVNAYSAADVVVSVPPSDGFPQAVLEAIACDCPVVLSNLDRLHDVLTPGDHAIYTEIDSASVADAILSTLSDRAASSARTTRARARIREIADLGENTDRVERRFLELVAAS